MLTSNPFSELSSLIPPAGMQTYVVVMFLLVVGATILDVIHKKSAKYFFEKMKTAKERRAQPLSSATVVSVSVKTVVHDILTSAEFDNPQRRKAHLLTMYGFILFVVTTVIMIFSYPTPETPTPALVALLWHVGALMVCVGGYWFWFKMRVDVAAEGHKWYRLIPADLFILSLLATTTLALIWSLFGGTFLFALFIFASTVLFGSVFWSKFAHMFFKPAAAFQKRFAEADGSRDNLPEPADKPAQFGLGIKRDLPRHY
ncbi:adenylyl-sulfate reductase [Thioalkalicoccus limnaeus]|uniref:Adenylyl-sulfate reductase n=1 Tax=Thioalkalicoccus limnaeus TaxID=120681 RepID=A0ABV4BFP9_9GAMM